MNRQPESPAKNVCTWLLLRTGSALLMVAALLTATGKAQTQPENPFPSSAIHVTHVLGFEDVRRNVSGELSIVGEDLLFQRHGTPVAQVSITSIRNISLGEQDKQVGGVPMMLGKAAVPFGGGRVVSLFSHKKYDSVTVEYVDSTGGLHGAIFRLPKGQGDTFRHTLTTRGAHIAHSQDLDMVRGTSAESLKAQQWSVQVDRIDPGATTLDPCFSYATYENLLRELSNSKQFKHVFRSGDRTANDVSELLVLKTFVEQYSPGSETRRAVTTFTGATKMKVRIQLVTVDGHIIFERTVEGDIRFVGDNLGATGKVAKKTAKLLKQSTLPAPAGPYKATPKEVTAAL